MADEQSLGNFKDCWVLEGQVSFRSGHPNLIPANAWRMNNSLVFLSLELNFSENLVSVNVAAVNICRLFF